MFLKQTLKELNKSATEKKIDLKQVEIFSLKQTQAQNILGKKVNKAVLNVRDDWYSQESEWIVN